MGKETRFLFFLMWRSHLFINFPPFVYFMHLLKNSPTPPAMYQTLGLGAVSSSLFMRGGRLASMGKCNDREEKHLTQLPGPRTPLILERKNNLDAWSWKAQISLVILWVTTRYFSNYYPQLKVSLLWLCPWWHHVDALSSDVSIPFLLP